MSYKVKNFFKPLYDHMVSGISFFTCKNSDFIFTYEIYFIG